jgi:hypothetical protein
MRNARILFGLLLFIFPVFSFAQNADEAAKEKLRQQSDLIDQLLNDSKNLRLPENRAYVYAKIGSALWQNNQKRARELFQNSIAELIAAQAEAETEKGSQQYFQSLIYGQQPRWNILFLIAARDAEFALEAMLKTRPARISRVVVNFSDDYTADQQYARTELQNEQRLLSIAAEQNPERAVKLIRESLKKGVTYETVNLLRKVFEKNAEMGNSLAEEVGQRFLDTNFDENRQVLDVLGYFLSEATRQKSAEEKAFKVSDETIRALASKILDYWFKPGNSLYGYGSSFSIVEKFFPARAAEAKKRYEQVNSQNQTEQQQEYYKLLQSDVSAEELIRQAPNMPRAWRNELYRRAAEKMAQNGNVSQAEKILTDNLSEQETDYYISQFNYNLVNQAVSKGNYDEAVGFAARITNLSYRISALTQIANAIFQKDPKENKRAALSVLDRARTLISDPPESFDEITMLLNLSNAYGAIEPARAFDLLESLTDSFNEIIQASAVLAKYRPTGNFRQGEFAVVNGQFSYNVPSFDYILQTLKNSDFKRAVSFTGRFHRADTRIALQLHLIDENFSNGITNMQIMELPVGTRFSIN